MSESPMQNPDLELDDESLAYLRAEKGRQVRDALSFLARPASDFLALPFRALDLLVARLGPGGVGFICAFTGSGKSTLTTSAIDRWVDGGKRVYHMPLETVPHEWRTRWACHRLGINAGDVMGGVAQQHPSWPDIVERLRAEVKSQKLDALKERGLWVDPVRQVTAAGLRRAAESAAVWGADVLVVDHIDHVKGGDRGDFFGESRKVNETLHETTLETQVRVVATSQLNLDITRPDRLAKYSAPQMKDVYMGGHKGHIATWMIGLFRPLRDRRSDEPPPPKGSRAADPYLAAIKAAREGTAEPWTALKAGVMGAVAMKLRNQGKNDDGSVRHEGARCELGFEDGRVVDLHPRDAYKTTFV